MQEPDGHHAGPAPDLSVASGGPTPPFQRLDRAGAPPYGRDVYAARFAWEWIEALAIRPSWRRAHGWRRFWLRRFGARLADTAAVRPSVSVLMPWRLEMGEWSILSDRVDVYNIGPVTIGAHTVVSQDVYLCAGTHDHTQPTLPLVRAPVTIGHGVWICAGAFIGPGVTVGDNAVVGARAVVTRDVPPGMIVAGNPARVIKPRLMGADEPPDTGAADRPARERS